jgi:hypothetical protein
VSGSIKESSTSLQDAIDNKGVMSIDTSTPSIQTGGRDSLPLRQTIAPASPSALDFVGFPSTGMALTLSQDYICAAKRCSFSVYLPVYLYSGYNQFLTNWIKA